MTAVSIAHRSASGVTLAVALALSSCASPSGLPEDREQVQPSRSETVDTDYSGPPTLSVETDPGRILLTGWRPAGSTCLHMVQISYLSAGPIGRGDLSVQIHYAPKSVPGGSCESLDYWLRFQLAYEVPAGRTYRVRVRDPQNSGMEIDTLVFVP